MISFAIDRRVIVLALARMADAVGNSFLVVVLPLYVTSGLVGGGTFGLTEAMITGIILSAVGLLNSTAQPFVGRLSDRLGRRQVFVLVGLGLLTLSNAAYAFAGTYVSILLVRAVQGIAIAFTVPSTIALVNELATIDTRGGNMGVFNTFRLIGYGVGPVVSGLILAAGPYDIGAATLSGFEAAFAVASLTAFVSLLLVAAFVRDPEETTAAAGEDLEVAILSPEPDRRLDPVFTLGLASLAMAIGIALMSTIQPEVNAHLEQSPAMFGVEFAAFVAPQVVFQTPIGRATDLYGRKRFVLWGLLLLVPATFVQGLVATPAGMIVARFVQGVAGAMVFAPALALAGDLAREGHSGTQLSVLTMAFGLGTAIGPFSSGYLIRFGYVAPFAFGAAIAGLCAVLVYTEVEETVGRAGPGSTHADGVAEAVD